MVSKVLLFKEAEDGLVCLLQAFDDDESGNDNSKIEYIIISGNDDGYFELDMSSTTGGGNIVHIIYIFVMITSR